MYLKLPPKDLNLGSYSPYPTSTYTCRMTIVLRVYGGIYLDLKSNNLYVALNGSKIAFN